jgi:hypothetical protein
MRSELRALSTTVFQSKKVAYDHEYIAGVESGDDEPMILECTTISGSRTHPK